MVPIFSSSSITKSGEKTSVSSVYTLKISDKVFSYYRLANNRVHKGCVDITDSGYPRSVK